LTRGRGNEDDQALKIAGPWMQPAVRSDMARPTDASADRQQDHHKQNAHLHSPHPRLLFIPANPDDKPGPHTIHDDQFGGQIDSSVASPTKQDCQNVADSVNGFLGIAQ
jgi:hypothetical protein